MTPYERWYGKKPDLKHLRVFGCIAYAHVPDKQRQKLDKKTEKLRFVGYSTESKGYRLLNDKTHKVVVRRDVAFNEKDFGNTNVEEKIKTVEVDIPSVQEEIEKSTPAPTEHRYRLREKRVEPTRYGYDEFVSLSLEQVSEPSSLREALQGDLAEEWGKAADSEFQSLIENNTWDLVELPKNKKPIGCKWVFKAKHGEDGSVVRYKGRLVAKGYSQKYGEDYVETFAPVVRFSSIRVLLAHSIQNDMLVHQMDVQTAFLNGTLEEEIFMQQPEGYVQAGKEHLVCRLNRSLYGLKQSPRCWNAAFTNFMSSKGFSANSADPCVFTKADCGCVSVVAVYVDDLIIITKTSKEMQEIKDTLAKQFKMKDLGKLHFCLGISVHHDQETNRLWIHQQQYITSMLKKYGLAEANPVSTPADPNVTLEKNDGNSCAVDQTMYQSMVGTLLYAATTTRPDIAHAVSVVAKFSSAPTAAHLTAVKRIFRYLKATKHVGLCYEKTATGGLSGYSDADWAGDRDDRRSTSGHVFLMAKGAVSWCSKKQSVVALSTSEAEYVALSQATQELVWLRRLLAGIGQPIEGPTTLYEDNQGTIAIARNPISHSRTKHIDIKYHFVRDAVQEGTIELIYCPTEVMIADLLTKGLPRVRHNTLCKSVGLVELPNLS